MSMVRRLSPIGLALLLLVGVSCTASDTTLTEPHVPANQQAAPSLDLIGDLTNTVGSVTGSVVGTLGSVTDLLTCSAQRYTKVTQTIGPSGGTIKVGSHVLIIPQNALAQPVKITAEQMSGSTNSVRFSPEGLHFQRPAVLTMSYKNCAINLLKKKIVYTDERLSILQLLFSLDYPKYDYVTSPIDHFSRYAVAY
jgi:hypothetical protein